MAGRAEPPGSSGRPEGANSSPEPTPPSWVLAGVEYQSTWDLPPLEETVGAARRMVVDACESYGLAGLADDAALLTSEVVTNAVRHASEPIQVRTGRHRDGVVVAVRDDSEVMPVISHLERYAERGRGMHLVDALAVQWGIETDRSPGKTVWFHLVPLAGNARQRA